MTHKELIQNLRICGKGGNCLGCELDGKCSGINSILTDAADRLEALRTENDQLREAMKMMPKWRPASEPPEEYRDEYDELQCFLVCAEHCVEPFRAVYDGEHWGDGWNVLAVTHWMPLPSTEGVE